MTTDEGTIVPATFDGRFAACGSAVVLRLRARTGRYAQDDKAASTANEESRA